MKLYPAGYTRSPVWIARLMREHPHLLLCDTRLKPWSQLPAWRATSLQATYGDRYRWVGAHLGNRNYRGGGPVDLIDPEKGLVRVRDWLTNGADLLLVCGCADYTRCHVRTIVDFLRADLPNIEVIMPPEPANGTETPLALSIRQPWTWLLTHPEKVAACGCEPKTLENRTWTTRYRGPLLLHASTTIETDFFDRRSGLLLPDYWIWKFGEAGARLAQRMPQHRGEYPTRAIVGEAELVEVVRASASPWFGGPYGLVLAGARTITPPVRYPGSRKLFAVPDWPAVRAREETAL